MANQENPYVTQELKELRIRFLELRPQLTRKGSAILGGLLVDLDRLKHNAQPQCPPDESKRRCERGAYQD